MRPSGGAPPDPRNAPSLFEWAKRITEFLSDKDSVKTPVVAKPVLLSHYQAADLPRAAVDGLLMYDPVLLAPVVSIGGAFRPMVAGASGEAASVASGGSVVSFGRTFTNPPAVIATTNIDPGTGMYQVHVYDVTTTGFSARIKFYNGTTVSDVAGTINWIAIGA